MTFNKFVNDSPAGWTALSAKALNLFGDFSGNC